MVVEDLSTSTEVEPDLEPEAEIELELEPDEWPEAEIELELVLEPDLEPEYEIELELELDLEPEAWTEVELLDVEDPLPLTVMAITRFITSGLFKMLCVEANSCSSWAILVRSAYSTAEREAMAIRLTHETAQRVRELLSLVEVTGALVSSPVSMDLPLSAALSNLSI